MKKYSINQLKLIDKLKNSLNESTSLKNSVGRYNVPMSPGHRIFKKSQLGPFTEPVSSFNNAELAYDSYDHEMVCDNDEINDKEELSRKISIYNHNHPTQNDGDGDILNNDISIKKINEDLAVWFGTKKKPKGSKQPKGPWVNICKKVDGKHPPCGRPDADTKSYPKCRAAGVAGKMSDSEKKSACAQKRRAEKKEPKYGKGNKPTMTSYKPNNESYLDDLIRKVLHEEIFKNY